LAAVSITTARLVVALLPALSLTVAESVYVPSVSAEPLRSTVQLPPDAVTVVENTVAFEASLSVTRTALPFSAVPVNTRVLSRVMKSLALAPAVSCVIPVMATVGAVRSTVIDWVAAAVTPEDCVAMAVPVRSSDQIPEPLAVTVPIEVPSSFTATEDPAAARPVNTKVASLVTKSLPLTPLSLVIAEIVVAAIDVLLPAPSVAVTVTLLVAVMPLAGNEPDTGVAVLVSRLQVWLPRTEAEYVT